MEQKRPTPNFTSAAFVSGELMATQAALFALARLMPDPLAARAAMLQATERLRVAGLPSGMPDDFLLGIDRTERTLRAVLPADEPR
jgi:hypothetical protein